MKKKNVDADVELPPFIVEIVGTDPVRVRPARIIGDLDPNSFTDEFLNMVAAAIIRSPEKEVTRLMETIVAFTPSLAMEKSKNLMTNIARISKLYAEKKDHLYAVRWYITRDFSTQMLIKLAEDDIPCPVAIYWR
jgi:hypothetical protein